MANIIAKAYDATKKIVTSIFLGKPNLFTTADVNRYIEQTRAELDFLHSMVGFESDFSIDGLSSSKSLTISISTKFTYINFRGISFSPSKITKDVDFSDMNDVYVLLLAKKKRVTFADDSTHDIAGAKFDDGSSMASADQEIMYDEKLVITTDSSYGEKGFVKVGMLGYIRPFVGLVMKEEDDSEVKSYRFYFFSNCSANPYSEGLPFRQPMMGTLDVTKTGVVTRNDSHTSAITKLSNNLKDTFGNPYLIEGAFVDLYGGKIKAAFRAGHIIFSFDDIDYKVTTSANDPRIIKIPFTNGSVKKILLDYYKSVLLDNSARLSMDEVLLKGYFIPITDSTVVSGYRQEPRFGTGKFGIMLEVSGSDGSYSIVDCYLCGVLQTLINFNGDKGDTSTTYGSEGGIIVASIIKDYHYVVRGGTFFIPIMSYKGV